MAIKTQEFPVAQNPLILKASRMIDTFAKSDDERDFYLDRVEGYILYLDLDKSDEDLKQLIDEIKQHAARYVLIPKFTYYEVKKIMEGFINEKVYDIDTKEKLLDILQSKEARENFLEFLYDHEAELEKWHQYYQERSRVRIIEWLRSQNFQFVFEEDLELPRDTIEKLKMHLFENKVAKDIAQARQAVIAKAKTYYSLEALNPRPKRGRPPKQVVKIETEPKASLDIYTTVPGEVRRLLYLPDITTPSSLSFSGRFDTEEEFLKYRRASKRENQLDLLSQRLESLKRLSSQLGKMDIGEKLPSFAEEDDDDEEEAPKPAKAAKASKKPTPPKKRKS